MVSVLEQIELQPENKTESAQTDLYTKPVLMYYSIPHSLLILLPGATFSADRYLKSIVGTLSPPDLLL